MNNGKNISQTAMMIASLRALACYEEDPCIRGKDRMAELFLPDDKRNPLKNLEFRNMIKKMIPEGLYEYIIARTKYFDELFLQYLKLQIPQIVFLGAGYDSRAYRFENRIKNTVIYETDAPATQEEKLLILKDNDVNRHNNVLYVAVDFEKDNLFQSLCYAGFNRSLQTLFIWEGVTFYLSSKSVDAMLAAVKQNSAAESILCFDFQHIETEQDLIDTGLTNERIKFGMRAEECEGYLSSFGYTVLEEINAEQMCGRYLTMADGKRFGDIKSIMNIIKIKVN